MRILIRILCTVSAISIFTVFPGCQKIKTEPSVRDRVLLYYAAGFNNLSSYLEEDINELCYKGYVPEKTSGNVLLIFQNLAQGNYSTPATPTLYRVYKNEDGQAVKEEIFTFEPGTVAAASKTLFSVLSYIRYNFPSDKYGMIFSSHATGWIPASVSTRALEDSASPSSIGNEYSPETGTGVTYEMNLDEFADAIPMHLDYILFDACFMGGVEVAYQLKDVCDRIAFSQAEVIADGFDYTTMASYLLQSDSDIYGVCQAYYEHYENLTGDYHSATVSLVDCSSMDALAESCKRIYDAHRADLDSLDPDEIQCFGRISAHKFFYDLEDIMNHLNLSDEEKADFDSALDDCILYAATTGRMINLTIREFCGLSSYCTNIFTYDEFYKTLAWNQATGMIK